MTSIMQQFIDKVFVIKKSNPKYRQPGDGSDGTCDCIGLIIGALRRIGINWSSVPGSIHGTNYAARKAVTGFSKINSSSDLEVGEAVFKVYEKGQKGWTLDKYPRYLKGGKYYNGDLNDYYHVGVVTSVSPLGITHMSSTCKTDTSLGQWKYHGKLNLLVKKNAYTTGDNAKQDVKESEDKQIAVEKDVNNATVFADNGKCVKMRMKPSTSCNMYDELPCGTIVKVVERGNEWSKISYGTRKGWYMMTKFLK